MSSNWVELKDPKDRKYYHNRLTNETRWDKPIELQSASELATSKSVWKEFTSDNGKKYYYNTQTKESVWEEPQELKSIRLQFSPPNTTQNAQNNINHIPLGAVVVGKIMQNQNQQQQPLNVIQNNNIRTDFQNQVINSQRQQNQQQQQFTDITNQQQQQSNPDDDKYKDQQHRYDTFRQLLNDFNVHSSWNWETTMRTIINDPRYSALKTIQDKKKALVDHQADRRQFEREEKKKHEQKQRDLFVAMLKECTYLKPRMTWQRALPYFEGDVRLFTIPETERIQIFNEYIKDVEHKEKERLREERKKSMDHFRNVLLNDSSITLASQWRHVKDNWNADPLINSLERMDKLVVFQDVIQELDEREKQKQRSEHQQFKQTSRKHRETYRQFLQESYDNGSLNIRTRWNDFLEATKTEPRYLSMISLGQMGSLASELFGDFIEELFDKFQEEKKAIKEHFKSIRFTMSPTTTKSEFLNAIRSNSTLAKYKEKDTDMLFEELIAKAQKEEKKREQDEESKKKRLEKKFISKLRDLEIQSNATWDDVKDKVKDVIPDLSEAEKQKAFGVFLTRKDELSSDEEGMIKDKKAKKEKKRKHSPDDRDKERSRDRDSKSNSSSSGNSTRKGDRKRSRSPEPNNQEKRAKTDSEHEPIDQQ